MSGSGGKAEGFAPPAAPASTKRDAHALEVVAPALKSARSKPSMVSSASTRQATPSSSRPAERSEAKGTISLAGKPRSRSLARMTVPTAPVAPTTATRYRLIEPPPPGESPSGRLLPAKRAPSEAVTRPPAEAGARLRRSCRCSKRVLGLDLVGAEFERLVQGAHRAVDAV